MDMKEMAEAAKAAASARKIYRLQAGTGAYVCNDGVRITAPAGIISEYDDKYIPEFEANVKCGNFSYCTLEDAVRPEQGAIVAME